jgi:hypothetical protein
MGKMLGEEKSQEMVNMAISCLAAKQYSDKIYTADDPTRGRALAARYSSSTSGS